MDTSEEWRKVIWIKFAQKRFVVALCSLVSQSLWSLQMCILVIPFCVALVKRVGSFYYEQDLHGHRDESYVHKIHIDQWDYFSARNISKDIDFETNKKLQIEALLRNIPAHIQRLILLNLLLDTSLFERFLSGCCRFVSFPGSAPEQSGLTTACVCMHYSVRYMSWSACGVSTDEEHAIQNDTVI